MPSPPTPRTRCADGEDADDGDVERPHDHGRGGHSRARPVAGRDRAAAAPGLRSGRAEVGDPHGARGLPDADGGAARQEADIAEDVLVTDPVDGLDRLRAKQALPAAELQWLESEAALEQARRAAAVRSARSASGCSPGTAMVRRELPRLLREQRQLQRQWQQLSPVALAHHRTFLAHPRLPEEASASVRPQRGEWAEIGIDNAIRHKLPPGG